MANERATKTYKERWNKNPGGRNRWQFLWHDKTTNKKLIEGDGELSDVLPKAEALALQEYGEGWLEVWVGSGPGYESGLGNPTPYDDYVPGQVRLGWMEVKGGLI